MGNLFSGACSRDKWRNPDKRLKWSVEFRNTLIDEIKEIPLHKSIKPCILLVGPMGAGKSSVVNSFLTAGAGRVIRKAETGRAPKSVTLKFMRYDGIPKLEEYRLCDTTGILRQHGQDNNGLHPEDILKLMQGHIGPGYEFKYDKPISEDAKEYVKAPGDKDKSHCLAIVIPSMQMIEISEGFSKKILNAIQSARSQDIPTVIILTKIDELCINVMRNPSKVFTCEHVKEVVENVEATFGVPQGFIFPMMNYASVLVKDDRMDIINLLVLKKILEFTSDSIEGPVKQNIEKS